jgi:FlaA1/EpsC-like NDP-sugar epimerase
MLAQSILKSPQNIKRLIALSVDLFLLPFALWASFSLRLGEFYWPVGDIRYLFAVIPVIAFPIFVRFGLYRAIIRYIGFLAMWAVIKVVSLYTLVWGVVVLLSAVPGVPRSVLLINCLVTVLLIVGSHAIARWWLSGSFELKSRNRLQKRVAIYGAGSSGFKPVAFIDDKKTLQRNYIAGLRVFAFSQLSSPSYDKIYLSLIHRVDAMLFNSVII